MSGRRWAKARLRYWATNSMSINPPLTSFKSQASLSPFSAAIEGAHRADVAGDFPASRFRARTSRTVLATSAREACVSGDDARSRQRHVLPGFRLVR